MAKTNTSKVGTLPRATVAQRLASLSIPQLMDAARKLAADPEQDALCTTVLDELEKRTRGGAAFDAFVAELFPTAENA